MDMSQFVIPRKVEIPDGAYGVWQIPELNIVIPVYSAQNPNRRNNLSHQLRWLKWKL